MFQPAVSSNPPRRRALPAIPLRRIVIAALLSCAVGIPIVTTLLARVPDVEETRIVSEHLPWERRPVPLLRQPVAGRSGHLYTLSLHLPSIEALLQYPEVRILFATDDEAVTLAVAELRVTGTSCAYVSGPDARLRNNDLLAFRRASGCSAPLQGTSTGNLELRVVLRESVTLSVWTFVTPGGFSDRNVIYVVGRDLLSGTQPALRGVFVRELGLSGLRRIDMLTYLWDLAPTPSWIWLALAVAAAAMTGALVVCPAPHDPHRVYGAAAAGFLLTGAIGLAYAVLTPPFQAPDEPAHFLAFARLTGRSASTAEQWLRRDHVERLRGHSEERFRPSHMRFAVDMLPPELQAVTMPERSATTDRLWRTLGTVTGQLSDPQAFVILRTANVLLFALVAGAASALIAWATTASIPYLLLSLLIAPAVPFFGMQVSNYGMLISGYVLVWAAVYVLLDNSPRAWIAGPLAGMGASLAIASSRSALPSAPLIVAIALVRMLLGSRSGWRSSLGFWIGALAGVVLFAGVAGSNYTSALSEAFRTEAPAFLRPAGALPLRLVLLIAAVAGFSIERGLHRLPPPQVPYLRMLTRYSGLILASVVIVLLIGSVTWDLPSVPMLNRRDAMPPLDAYLSNVRWSVATLFRMRDFDFLLWTSFWGALGWLDTLLAPSFLAAIAVVNAAALAYSLVAADSDTKRLAGLLILLAGAAGSVEFYARAAYAIGDNPHGRYLTGVYLVALATSWSALVIGRRRNVGSGTVAALVSGAVCGSIHAYALQTLLSRYF